MMDMFLDTRIPEFQIIRNITSDNIFVGILKCELADQEKHKIKCPTNRNDFTVFDLSTYIFMYLFIDYII